MANLSGRSGGTRERPRQLHLFERLSDANDLKQEHRSKWLNSPTEFCAGTLSEIRRCLPDFERHPFILAHQEGIPSRINERLDTIVRKPVEDDPAFLPVGVVSKSYVLVSHREVLDAAAEALEAARIDPGGVTAELTITEYGERSRLCIDLPDSYSFDPGDHHDVAMRLECLNSVDTSVRFRTLVGWFRFVCSNGIVVGTTQGDFHRRHSTDLTIQDIGRVLQRGISDAGQEKINLQEWLKTRITLERATSWVEKDVRREWGFKAATRTYHILRTGYDVDLTGSYKDQTPTTISVQKRTKVPGAPEKAQNAFDISQILAWLAKERNEIMEQFEWREQIPDLMKALLD